MMDFTLLVKYYNEEKNCKSDVIANLHLLCQTGVHRGVEQILHAMRLFAEALRSAGDVFSRQSTLVRQSEEKSQRGIHRSQTDAGLVESEHLLQHQTQAAGWFLGCGPEGDEVL